MDHKIARCLSLLARLFLVVALILTASAGLAPVFADDPVTAPPGLTAEPGDPPIHSLGIEDQEAWEWEVIRLVNEERTSRGIPPLKFNANLRAAARAHTQDMGADDYFAHDSYDYSGGTWHYVQSWSTRISAYYTGSLSENAAAGHGSPASVMAGWMNSSGHRSNILSTGRWEIGVGYYYDASDAGNIYVPHREPYYNNGPYYHYWVQDFGRRSDVYPVIINNEAYSTTHRTVQLHVYGPSGAQEMRFSNDGINWSDWETYDSDKTWDLASGTTGIRTVHAQVRDGSQTFDTSDDIHYVTNGPVLSVDPTAITFLTQQGNGLCVPAMHAVRVSNTGSGALTWEASESSAWFDITPGTDTVTVTCVANVVKSYTTGQQNGTITITAPDAQNSPQTTSATLIVATEIHTVALPLVTRNYSSP
jgi:uncharacterized protein YkwD